MTAPWRWPCALRRVCTTPPLCTRQNVSRLNLAARTLQTLHFCQKWPVLRGNRRRRRRVYHPSTIATPTGEGTTSARTFARLRRCVLTNGFFHSLNRGAPCIPFICKPRLYSGPGSLAALQRFSHQHIWIVCDGFLARSPLLDRLRARAARQQPRQRVQRYYTGSDHSHRGERDSADAGPCVRRW
ncbi:propanediol utilization protein PduQ [Klebsiella pneumoniae subsp. ozaenae]|uniref:Propanediol utilization protein PduQ n=1 Tax=Klebsiella pneumoniae subsp. ozaenae TaxID=574 RepID=A0A377Z6K8_KLEPO|nr:propanediol utilization protein PduQ [Klebsiella pneumoniae subsp. ozaenae]